MSSVLSHIYVDKKSANDNVTESTNESDAHTLHQRCVNVLLNVLFSRFYYVQLQRCTNGNLNVYVYVEPQRRNDV